MGQRHQIYIVQKKQNKYSALTAHHHQWCFGITAATNCIRLVEAIRRAKVRDGKFESFYCYDQREFDTLVTSIYGIDDDGFVSMVDDEREYLIEDGQIRPERGDNNDGCTLVIVDYDSNTIRACMFTPHHVEGKERHKCRAWTPYTPLQYAKFYYLDPLEQEGFHKSRIADLKTGNVGTVTKQEFKKIMAASLAKEFADECEVENV